MVFIKKVNNADAGDADHVGGNDWDTLDDYFADVATGKVAKIDSVTNFRSGRLRVTNPANTFTYRFNGDAIVADRILTLPLLTSDDTIVTLNFAQTLANKTLASSCVVPDATLTSNIVMLNRDNDHGDFDNSFRDNKLRIWNPADTFRMTFICPAISGNRNLNLPLTTGTDTLTALGMTQTFTGSDTFNDNVLKIRNPGDTFSYSIRSGAIAANRDLNLPVITGTDTISTLGLAQTITAAKTYNNSTLKLRNPADTFSYTVVPSAIGADRNLILPLLTGNDTVVAEAHTATITNKTMNMGGYANPSGNIVQGSSISNPYQGAGTGATLKRYGLFTCTSSNAGEGLFNNSLTAVGTHSRVNDTTEGLVGQFATTAVANANAGLRQTVAFYRREWTSYAILRVKPSSTSDIRCFIGWSSDGSEIAGETTLNNFSGCGIGKRTGDTNWQVMRNDGDATEDRTDTGIAFPTTWTTIEMKIDSSGFDCKIGGTSQTQVTTEIPAAATDLMFHCEVETGAGAADKNIQIAPIWTSTGVS